MAQSIGLVQTAQRLGPALGPVIGGVVAACVGLRTTFLVTAGFYLVAFVLMAVVYVETRGVSRRARTAPSERVTFSNVLAFENFLLLMALIFGFQFVDRSLGPVLPLHLSSIGVAGLEGGAGLRRDLFRAGVCRRARPSPLRAVPVALGRATIADSCLADGGGRCRRDDALGERLALRRGGLDLRSRDRRRDDGRLHDGGERHSRGRTCVRASGSSPARHWSAWRSARWWPVCWRTLASAPCSWWTA